MPEVTESRNRNTPGYYSVSYLAQIEAVDTCRHVFEGTQRLRTEGETYLPQFPKEKDEAYKIRRDQSVLFNAFRRTVKGLVGMVFRKDPVLDEENTPEDIHAHWENIDLAGRHGTVFARHIFEAKVIDGHTVILVDWRDAEGARNRAEERGARPYWVHVRKDSIIRWRTESRNGETVLTSFAYKEQDTVPDGEFAEEIITRVRQYDLEDGAVRYRSWVRTAKSGGDWRAEDDEMLGERMTRIPVVVDYADRGDTLVSQPPLLDLAYENIRHYQLRSDRDNLLHVSHVPVPVFIGEEKSKVANITLGSTFAVVLENPDADAKFIEASGSALEQSAKELEAIEERMAALGIAVLVRRDRVERTATESANQKAEQDSDLAAMARATGDALAEALKLHAMWMGRDDGGTVAMNKDYQPQQIRPEVVGVLHQMVQAGDLSVETLWERLVAGEILDEAFDPEEERARIETEPGGRLLAVRDSIRNMDGQEGGGEVQGAA